MKMLLGDNERQAHCCWGDTVLLCNQPDPAEYDHLLGSRQSLLGKPARHHITNIQQIVKEKLLQCCQIAAMADLMYHC